MWPFKPSLEKRRRKALARTTNPVMQQFLQSSLPDKKSDWRNLPVVALDLETTGLNPKKDRIISIGLVEMHNGSIHLDSAWHKIVTAGMDIPEESAIIHHLTDDVVAAGEPIDKLLPELLEKLAGKTMLVHYAFVEQEFINMACQRLYGAPFVIPTIDTLKMAHRAMLKRNHTVQAGELRLFNLRRIFELPDYRAHNALYDAISTAELFLAMAAEANPTGKQPIGDYLT
jgi:DNA polymerase-3 subunit epsilon